MAAQYIARQPARERVGGSLTLLESSVRSDLHGAPHCERRGSLRDRLGGAGPRGVPRGARAVASRSIVREHLDRIESTEAIGRRETVGVTKVLGCIFGGICLHLRPRIRAPGLALLEDAQLRCGLLLEGNRTCSFHVDRGRPPRTPRGRDLRVCVVSRCALGRASLFL